MEKHIDADETQLVEVTHVHAIVSWKVLWTVVFWLMNLWNEVYVPSKFMNSTLE